MNHDFEPTRANPHPCCPRAHKGLSLTTLGGTLVAVVRDPALLACFAVLLLGAALYVRSITGRGIHPGEKLEHWSDHMHGTSTPLIADPAWARTALLSDLALGAASSYLYACLLLRIDTDQAFALQSLATLATVAAVVYTHRRATRPGRRDRAPAPAGAAL